MNYQKELDNAQCYIANAKAEIPESEVDALLARGQENMLAKWGHVLTVEGKSARLTGALKIGEAKELNRDLLAAGFAPSGQQVKYSNGEACQQAYILPAFAPAAAKHLYWVNEWSAREQSRSVGIGF